MTSSEAEPTPAPPQPGPRQRRPGWRWVLPRPYEPVGLVGAALLVWASLTPSLLPRAAVFQGAVSGVSAALGYGLGVLGLAVVRFMLERPLRWRPGRRTGVVLAAVFVVVTAFSLWRYAGWQADLRELMGLEQLSVGHYAGLVAVAAVVSVLLVGIGRLVGTGTRGLVRLLSKVAPPRVSAVVGIVVVLVLVGALFNDVVAGRLLSSMDAGFKAVNDETHADSPAPTQPELSGSPESLVTWGSLGRTGREFIDRTTTVADLEAFSGRPATQPVRAYVGLDTEATIADDAQLAVQELERAGGFDRSVICVVTTTGTGWVNEDSVSAVEYLYNGDTAVVSMQYSYLPSWLSFMVDQARAREAGRQLFNAVYARWNALPVGQRPKLVVNGESLGSFGAETAFSGVEDLRNRTDGALFVGPPFMNDLWSDLTAHRDPGSPEWLPTYQQGRTVRFMARPSDLDRPTAAWDGPRVVYLQYASDPITWWNPSLVLNRPDWLEEERGYDVLPQTRWFPLVTFLQLSADMAVGHLAPPGHGHRFGSDPANAWAAILQPAGWTAQDTERLRAVLTANAEERES
ncbi:MAG TPA: alpha/beta-hydrolase family protein [Nocardioides sp.]|uniref:alpha/beta hydrolase n=1 Tax=Nocardioides sp. TaxID=35761 RepID=UPI002C83C4D5|nr:alpha/beta-hydrolase family protein [Nocardioides sp.]HQR26554.1 alpha/beta-hydrolase family protein [Nocardioides sp.]